MSEPLRVMVVDDHPIWREGVARDLTEAGLSVVATADGVAAAGRRAAAVQPQVVLMDMHLPDGDGAAATAAVLDAAPETKVLILSASDERDDVLEAMKAGATGYLVKSASAAELLAAIESTAAGVPVFTPGLAGLVLGEYRRLATDSGPDVPTLTERETQILRQVAKGLTSREIAARLSISHRTVDNHIGAALRKLQLGNRVELARYALEHGITDDEG